MKHFNYVDTEGSNVKVVIHISREHGHAIAIKTGMLSSVLGISDICTRLAMPAHIKDYEDSILKVTDGLKILLYLR